MNSKSGMWFIALALLQACSGGGDSNSPTPSDGQGSGTTSTDTKPAAGDSSAMSPSTNSDPGTSTNPSNPPAGSAGAPAKQPTMHGSSDPAMEPMAMPTPTDTQPGSGMVMDECGLNTKWAGDEYCIKPPPADKGFQIHVGPTDYDNPEAQFVMEPNTETVESFDVTSGNTSDVLYYWRQYRMRPGTHHMILTAQDGGGFGLGRRLGGSQNLAWDNPANGQIPPENKDIGMPLSANTPINVNLHYMNFTDHPILKEVWVNFWYRDPKDVKQATNEVYSFAPMDVAPGQHVILSGTCPIDTAGRVLTLYGHRHANNLRFSIYREHAGTRDLVYDDYDWEEPLVAEYNSLVKNPAPDMAKKLPGGFSGPLDLAVGDNLYFECEIVNNTQNTFVGQNEAKGDEMCIMIGDSVGTTVPGFCTYNTQAL